jgi:hypothetical protein
VSADDPLAFALSEWQRKHHIADNDPMIAVLELVRLAVHHPAKSGGAGSLPPTFEEFRTTMGLLDMRSKAFVNQSADLIAELRRFAQTAERLKDIRATILVLLVALATGGGIGIGWLLCKWLAP